MNIIIYLLYLNIDIPTQGNLNYVMSYKIIDIINVPKFSVLVYLFT